MGWRRRRGSEWGEEASVSRSADKNDYCLKGIDFMHKSMHKIRAHCWPLRILSTRSPESVVATLDYPLYSTLKEKLYNVNDLKQFVGRPREIRQ